MTVKQFEYFYDLTPTDHKQIEQTERKYLHPNSIAPANRTMEWQSRNADIHIGVRAVGGSELCGSIEIVPLDAETYDKYLRRNNFDDANFTSADIAQYHNGGEYYLLFSAISIAPKYRQTPEVLLRLLQGFYKKLELLRERGIVFLNMCAGAQTTDGAGFIEKFLDLKWCGVSKSASKVYKFQTDRTDFNAWFARFPEYIESYRTKKCAGVE